MPHGIKEDMQGTLKQIVEMVVHQRLEPRLTPRRSRNKEVVAHNESGASRILAGVTRALVEW